MRPVRKMVHKLKDSATRSSEFSKLSRLSNPITFGNWPNFKVLLVLDLSVALSSKDTTSLQIGTIGHTMYRLPIPLPQHMRMVPLGMVIDLFQILYCHIDKGMMFMWC
jgi:hypothetical protein